jgi:hypothetical protein
VILFRFEVFAEVRIMTFFFWVVTSDTRTGVLEEHTLSIFRDKVVVFGSGEVYTG